MRLDARAFFKPDLEKGTPLPFFTMKDDELGAAFKTEEDDPFVYELGVVFGDEEHWIIQPFTGLVDNKDKKIYEGDIIRYPYAGGHDIDVIRFHGNGYWLLDGDGGMWLPAEREVIGNEIQNPNLID